MKPHAARREPTVSIGILAYNEEARLPSTLEDIVAQSLLTNSPEAVEIVVVANGCRDNTAGVARAFAEKNGLQEHLHVHDIRAPGKTNAWNLLVRQFTAPTSDILVLADADIRFLTNDTLERLVRGLREDRRAIASHGDSVKDLTLRAPRNLTEHFSAAFSRQSAKTARGMLCGQLYAIRADFARKMHLPLGLLVEDGFIKHMIVTEGFKKPEDLGRLHYISGVGNIFDGYVALRDIMVTQVRMCMGQTQIHLLKEDILRKLAERPDLPMLEYAEADDIDGPRWLDGILANHLQQRRWWVLHPGAMSHRIRRLRRLPAVARIKHLPLALVGTAIEAVICVLANQKLKEITASSQVWR